MTAAKITEDPRMNDASPQSELSHPDLYRTRDGGNVELLGMRCTECGYVAFPRQRYGCEKCGAGGSALTEIELQSSGTLVSFATVHMHLAKNIDAPSVIGEIEFDAGPTLRTTLVEANDECLEIGMPVSGRLHPAPGDAAPKFE